MDLKFLLNIYIYIFYGSEKAIQWAKRTLDAVNGNVKKKF